MTTAAENERLATLEVKVGRIETDVVEIKSDVKSLVVSHAAVASALAAKEAAEAAAAKKEAQTGVWVRFLAERAIAILALGVSIYVLLKG